MNTIHDYMEADFRIFPLWPIVNGQCGCGDPECEAVGKHPRMSNWQNVPVWSEEQTEVMVQMGQFATGFGVNVSGGYLIIDIDKRNGGFEGYEKLKSDTGIDYEQESGFVVATGGGGLHIYFTAPDQVSLAAKHKSYQGIDFKSSGYVVGAGSLHSSGQEYERKKGFPQDLTPAPQKLLDLLKRPDRIKAHIGDNQYMETSEEEIAEILKWIPNDGNGMDYDDFISIGMGVHDATGGAGFHLWDDWAQRSSKYSKHEMDKKWQSFGKSANPITLGTVIFHAEENGWRQPVIIGEASPEPVAPRPGLPIDIDSVDLLRPPGFVGEVASWINDQCRYPRERLAVATALNIMGNIIGLRHKDEYNDITANTIMLCVAGSGTGKEAVNQAAAELMQVAGISSAVHGNIKSEQEIVRNQVKHQASYYIVDEMGYLLQKIENAKKKGGASYLDGIIGQVMSLYTKAAGVYLVGGDLKENIREDCLKEINKLQKQLDKGTLSASLEFEFENRLKHLNDSVLPSIDKGIQRPFLSMIGYTTPVSFDELVTGEQATNGFISRCLLVREHETNPRRKRGFKSRPMPPELKARIQMLNTGMVGDNNLQWRVEWTGQMVGVNTMHDAQDALEDIADWFEEEAERQKANTGLEAVVRRGYEIVAKLSFIMGACDGQMRTLEHVRWAFAMARADMREKLRLAQTNILDGSRDANDVTTVLRNKILSHIGSEDGEPLSVICRRVGTKYSKQDVEAMVKHLIEGGQIEEVKRQTGGRPSVRYRSTA